MSEFLFDLPSQDLKKAERTFRQLQHPIWTESKAKLIETYLRYFVMVTKHGTYLDAFAGPQRTDKHDMWSAKLVIESHPRWFRTFHLFELDPVKVQTLREMWSSQAPRNTKKSEPKRSVNIIPGDFNQNVDKTLQEHPIKDSEAAFCLLDQRTFECNWASVEAVAKHKKGGNKIELFYFLPNAWFDRSWSALSNPDSDMRTWWGDSSWRQLTNLRGVERAKFACDSFAERLGYKHVYPFPIYERKDGGKMMYFMIHASDHDQATPLMYRAYGKALGVTERADQLQFLLDSNQAKAARPL